MNARNTTPAERDEPRAASTVLEVAAAWALVGVPLGWGVWQVAMKSLDLFRR